MWQHLAESLLMAYDQPQPVDQSAATPADNLARADVRVWAEYKAEPDADDAVIYRPTRTLLALLKIREGVLPPTLSKQFFRCALTAIAICTGPLANLELPMVNRLAEAIAATISQEDEEFADTLRMAVALTSPVALLRAICLRTIVIYLTESEFDPPEVVFYLVDLLQDTNKEVRKTTSKALDVIQDTSEEWAVKLRAIKFEDEMAMAPSLPVR
eukprot:jgi/Tetstr1/462981/TSEL_000097.t1